MKSFFRLLLAVLTFGLIFFVGFYYGSEKERTRIPTFQDDPDKS